MKWRQIHSLDELESFYKKVLPRLQRAAITLLQII